MTEIEYQRWRDFALCMTSHECREPNDDYSPCTNWVMKEVVYYLDLFKPEMAHIHGWDQGSGNPDAVYPCDWTLESQWQKVRYHPTTYDFTTPEERARFNKLWENDEDEQAEELIDEVVERWFTPVNCCLRAGIDVVMGHFHGVVGYTMGHVRQMYPEGLPSWFAKWFDNVDEISDDALIWL